MADLLANLSLGFSVATAFQNLGFCFLGVLIGTLVGVLPGVGPLAAISILLPATFGLPPIGALVMLAGIYYGAQYGGSTSSILLNIPGEASSVITALEGNQMAKQGRAGAALTIAALGSFFAGSIATILVATLAAPLAAAALLFGPWEFFSLMALGLIFSVTTSSGDRLKASSMALLGLALSVVGTDMEKGELRLTLGFPHLYNGLSFIIIAMGVFGFAEALRALSERQPAAPSAPSVPNLWLTKDEASRSALPVVRGTAVGSLLGILPGGGTVIASFGAYFVEKWWSGKRAPFSKGAIEGVAAPESANNAAAQMSFVPLLTLGIPSNPVMALMIGAMVLHGVTPGPQVMAKQAELFWGIVASMWVANLMLLIINLPLIGVWVWLLKLPRRHLFPLVIVLCCIGLYSVANARFDVMAAGFFGLVGYWLLRNGFDMAPLLMGLVLGPLMEEHLRRAMLLSSGETSLFLTRPLSGAFLTLGALIVGLSIVRRWRAP